MKSPSFKGQFVFTDNQDWAANGVLKTADTLKKSPDRVLHLQMKILWRNIYLLNPIVLRESLADRFFSCRPNLDQIYPHF